MFHTGSFFLLFQKRVKQHCAFSCAECVYSPLALFSFVTLNPPRLSKVALQPHPSLNPSEVPTLHLKRQCEEGEFGGGGWGVCWGRGVVLL